MPSSRPRRNQPPRESSISATVSRSSSGSPTDHKKSLRLTVKAPSSKLRQATSRGASSQAEELPRNARSSRPKKPIVDESEIDDDEDEDDAEADDDDDEEEEEEDAEGEEDDEMDVDAEADSDDDPVSAAPPPSRPVISRTGTAAHPKVTVTPAPTPSRPAPVESKQAMLAASKAAPSPSATATSDEELSELDDEDAEGEEEELDGEGDEDDGEGEDVDDEEEEEEDEEMGEGGSDDEDTGQGTPDVSKMTKRQRERFAGNIDDGAFLQLPMEPQVKKHLTAEEHAMRRAEMARRRKNLSEKRNEEEKRDTINRLLKKQAPKRRGKVSRQEEAEVEGDQEEDAEERPSKLFTRTISTKNGVKLGVPLEWEGKAVTGVLGNNISSPWHGPKVQVMEEA